MLRRDRARKVPRPMDAMHVSAKSPQEDEFALLALGARSPYEALLFPRFFDRAMATADPLDLGPAERASWIACFTNFIGWVQGSRPGRQLILKSPTHSYRVQLLCELFPEARFVHIVREPLAVFSSTIRLWQAMFSLYALTDLPDDAELETQVLRNWLRLEDKLEAALPSVRDRHIVRVRFEDLVAEPIAQLHRIYEELSLGVFATVRPLLEAYVQGIDGYQPRGAVLAAETERRVRTTWAEIFSRYDYPGPAKARG